MKNNLLAGKRGIIFGALDEKSIAWKVAERAIEEGAKITLTNTPVGIRMGNIKDLAEKLGVELIPADATKVEELKTLVTQSMDTLGGNLDFVLHSIAMSPNVRHKNKYTDLNYDLMVKTFDISAFSLHKLLQVAIDVDAFNEWGSVVGLSYIAAQRTFPGYSDMAEAKAALESIARSFGYHYGLKKKVRVNTISQSPTYTIAGSNVPGFEKFLSYSDKMSPLGNASADDCANFCIAMFSDLTRMVTMQNLFHDGGLSSVGVSDAVMNLFDPEND